MRAPESQSASAVIMIRPACFGYDEETAASNAFQRRPHRVADDKTQPRALAEIEGFASRLQEAGVRVVWWEDTLEPPKPDACFPNNWLSTHADGTVVLYPMATKSRRPEVRRELLAALEAREGYDVRRVIDLTPLAERGLHLEGTGSVVLDRPARVAYACLSSRTSPEALRELGARLGYQTFCFRAEDLEGHAIYHTNVMLSLGTDFAVVDERAVCEDGARSELVARLERSERVVIELESGQLGEFCGNVLELRAEDGHAVIAMSERARYAFTRRQLERLEGCGELVASPLNTIETIGGGSARCTLAELFLPDATRAAGVRSTA